ncbi:CaiB/BaiF CoA transferase family protein [Thalassobaculum litoreum]|uniref:Crotonobetainyl-CoA:carnitine CoA-transferase CaiB n=1 Tax=Thalassobaculum litoreum DSM 18839 TaxID=1123362 RepID=A0A8G2BKB3_9PROT|nr:CoA transferase [Thalassobaculum litoreum]SDG20392.1 Crotonobetainyl-CoA:carnitine CoA-transferase CaiB [Thalassobaculum litoreum DSM 18839]
MAGPLKGFRIIDLTNVVSGPLGTMMLADQGAEVIKIEHPAGGDFTRAMANRRGGFSASFLNNNRSKKSVALNLKDPRGVAAVLKLAATADAFVQNFRPGVVDRMGLGEAAVRAANPSIVYCSISGFGDKGPYADKPVYDPLVQALSGLTSIQGGSDDARPRLVRTIIPDKLTGYTSAQAITAGLLKRERTGEGQHVKVSMLDSVIDFLWHSDMGSQTFVGGEFAQEKAASFIDLIYETTDGHITVAVNTDKQWKSLTAALERPEWLEDPRFLTPALRHENIDDRLTLTQEVLATDSSAHWLERLETHDVPCAPVLTRSAMIDHPQIRATGIVVELDHPQAGKVRQARPAATFSVSEPDLSHGAPVLGADTDALLASAGFTADEIAALRADGVAGTKEEDAA